MNKNDILHFPKGHELFTFGYDKFNNIYRRLTNGSFKMMRYDGNNTVRLNISGVRKSYTILNITLMINEISNVKNYHRRLIHPFENYSIDRLGKLFSHKKYKYINETTKLNHYTLYGSDGTTKLVSKMELISRYFNHKKSKFKNLDYGFMVTNLPYYFKLTSNPRDKEGIYISSRNTIICNDRLRGKDLYLPNTSLRIVVSILERKVWNYETGEELHKEITNGFNSGAYIYNFYDFKLKEVRKKRFYIKTETNKMTNEIILTILDA